MRIVVGIDYRPALLSRAGIGRATRELCKALARRDDVDLRLFGHSLARAGARCDVPANARLCRMPIPGRSLPFLRKLGLGADRLCGSPMVFHETDYVELEFSRAARVRTVHDLAFCRDASWHGADAANLRERTNRLARGARALIAPSQATANDVRAFLPDAPLPIVIPFGSDHVRAASSPRRDNVILCVGTIEPRKNHRALLAAIRSMRDKPLLVVIGRRGWECDAIVDDLRNAEREGFAQWIEAADDATTFASMQEATALAFPSLWEGFGFPPLEAMAQGLPVLAHDCAPMRELTDGAALLVDATSHEAIADGLARLLRDDALRTQLAQTGLRRASCYRWDDCAAAHANVYREAAR